MHVRSLGYPSDEKIRKRRRVGRGKHDHASSTHRSFRKRHEWTIAVVEIKERSNLVVWFVAPRMLLQKSQFDERTTMDQQPFLILSERPTVVDQEGPFQRVPRYPSVTSIDEVRPFASAKALPCREILVFVPFDRALTWLRNPIREDPEDDHYEERYTNPRSHRIFLRHLGSIRAQSSAQDDVGALPLAVS